MEAFWAGDIASTPFFEECDWQNDQKNDMLGNMSQDALTSKYQILVKDLPERSAVAFSGGVDSTFLLRAALDRGDALALLADTCFLPRRELAEARALAEAMGAEIRIVSIDVLALDDIVANGPERCYPCKKALFKRLLDVAGDRALLDGSNLDDLSEYRPGRRAVEELGIRSPLLENGWTKQEIRDMSQSLGLSTALKPAMACLATRISGPLRRESLAAVEAGEDILKDAGFPDVRLRSHGDVARIELPSSDMRRLLEKAPEITEGIKAAGFRFVALDLDGYRRGNMNGV